MLQIILSCDSPFDFFKEIGNHYLTNNYSFKGYQIEDIYCRIFELLNEQQIYSLKKDYLQRSKIKPKIFFDNPISKKERKRVLEDISKTHSIPLHKLFKHTVLISDGEEYYCALYQDNLCTTFTK
jgi:hypothetical protein